MDQDKRTLKFIDYVILIVKWKHILFPILFVTMVSTYLVIYFFVREEFEADSLIIPSQEESMGGIAGLLSGLQGLPVDIGGPMGTTEYSVYSTIIYSRTFLEDVIENFNLIDEYEISRSLVDYKELAIRLLTSYINLEINEDYSYVISVRAYTPEKAAEMTNYVVSKLNEKIIQLKVQKSSDNRKFLEERLLEIRSTLTRTEDSLKYYQKKTGLFEAEQQVKEILTAYSQLETELITKQIEKEILMKINPSSPQFEALSIQVAEYESKLNEIKKKGMPESPLIPYSSIPEAAINYYRILRDMEINNEILKFVLPLYEQARFEEQKDIPVLQVVDYAVPPPKKAYPPRTILTLSITFFVFLMIFSIILVKENENWKNEPKYLYIKQNMFRWKARN
jgi:capsule polysaccharide export protein KpsE/RkpR